MRLPELGRAIVAAAAAAGAFAEEKQQFYLARLAGINLSHGDLQPAFAPDVNSYTLQLKGEVDVLALSAQLQRAEEDPQQQQLVASPQIVISYPVNPSSRDELEEGGGSDSSTTGRVDVRGAGAKAEIDLPDDASPVTIKVQVMDVQGEGADGLQDDNREDERDEGSRGSPVELNVYSIRVQQSVTVAAIRAITITDDQGAAVATTPAVSPDVASYDVFVDPAASQLTVRVECSKAARAVINGSNGSSRTIAREKSHHRQLVNVDCTTGDRTMRHVLCIMSDFPADAIPVPKVSVGEQECPFEGGRFNCPDPATSDKTCRLASSLDSSVRYTLESSDKKVEVRLLDGRSSIAIPYTSGRFSVAALAGTQSVKWPLHFEGVSGLVSPGRISGWILGSLLLALLVLLLAVLGLTSLGAIGSPIGVTEVAAAFACLLQFCSLSAGSGSSAGKNDHGGVFQQMADTLRYATLYWPIPAWADSSAKAASSSGEAAARRLAAAATRDGPLVDVAYAEGCLFWSGVALGVVVLFHLLAVLRLKATGATFPHRLRFGNWEARALHFLAFPLSVASSHILWSDNERPGAKAGAAAKAVAAAVLAVLALWALAAFCSMFLAIRRGSVVWVWGTGLREDGALENDEGNWCDVECDQLLSLPANRSMCRWLFPWVWVSTVADIERVELCSAEEARELSAGRAVFAPDLFEAAAATPGVLQGKMAQSVAVWRTMPPSSCCGRRLACGLLRLSWIDILFTYESLTWFHTRAVGSGGVVPLTVKTCQLTGPVTGGRTHFFWDGARYPYARVGDMLLRCVAGLFMGFLLAGSPAPRAAPAFYTLLAIFCLGMLLWTYARRPYARGLENWVQLCLLLGVGLLALAEPVGKLLAEVGRDVCRAAAGLCVLLLAIYSAFICVQLLSAVLCPPLELSRFLEKLANCTAQIEAQDWNVEMPAYQKQQSARVYSHARKPLRFTAEEIVAACATGRLSKKTQ